MFFLMGVKNNREELGLKQTVICDNCGSYGRLSCYMDFKQLSIFFIPIIKWDKEYYIKTSCCGSIYRIDRSTGYDIERGKDVSVDLSKYKPINKKYYHNKSECKHCGHVLNKEYKYCPNCGKEIN